MTKALNISWKIAVAVAALTVLACIVSPLIATYITKVATGKEALLMALVYFGQWVMYMILALMFGTFCAAFGAADDAFFNFFMMAVFIGVCGWGLYNCWLIAAVRAPFGS